MYKRHLRLPCILFCSYALPASAQTAPTYDLSNLQVGAHFEYETSEGTSASSYLGYFGDAYVFSFWEKQYGEGATISRMGVTKKGQLLWSETTTPEGILSYYAMPHDCSFTLGQCQAELISDTRVFASMTVTTSYSNQVWTHIEATNYPAGERVTTYYCGVHDEHSVIIALYMKDSNGNTFWQQLSSGEHALNSDNALERARLACQQLTTNS